MRSQDVIRGEIDKLTEYIAKLDKELPKATGTKRETLEKAKTKAEGRRDRRHFALLAIDDEAEHTVRLFDVYEDEHDEPLGVIFARTPRTARILRYAEEHFGARLVEYPPLSAQTDRSDAVGLSSGPEKPHDPPTSPET